jgi:uncharacterized SAM-binding protein YcdF (DUF218 family)
VKQHSEGNKKVKRRRTITIITTALATIITGISLVLMLQRVPDMHIIFYLVLFFSALIVAYLIIWTLIAHEKYSRLAVILRRCYLVCLVIGIVGFIILQGFLISGARTQDAEVDALIILGAGLRDGAPSLVLRTRLNTAIEYLETQGDIPIVVTGGLGRGQTVTEAEAMFRYLAARGVDEAQIWKEEESTNTHESLALSTALLVEKGLDIESIRVGIVTNEFHLFRSKLIAGRAGLDPAGIAAATPTARLRALYFSREAVALLVEVLFRS